MIGVDGKGHKLGPIKFNLPKNYMDTWQFTSEDKSRRNELQTYVFSPFKIEFGDFCALSDCSFWVLRRNY